MSAEPAYLRIYEKIKQGIADDLYPKLSLPSERKLMANLDGTRITVREALIRLEKEGAIYRLNRRGWFIAPPRIRYSPHHKSHFIKTALAQGRKPETKVLFSKKTKIKGKDALNMGVENGSLDVHSIARLRELDSHPALYETIWLNANLTPNILEHSLEQSLTELMRREYQLEIKRTVVRVQPCVLSGKAAQSLLVSEGTSGLSITQQRYDQYGNLLEYDQELWRHDVIELVMTFEDE